MKKIIQYGGNINQTDAFGYTPLHICLSYKDRPENVTYLKNRLEIAEMLMNMGADADIRTVNKMTLLMIALRGNCPEHVSLVLNLCPPDVTAVDKFGRTALHHCIIKAKELKGLKEDLEESEIKHNQEIFDMLNTSKMDPDSICLYGKKVVNYKAEESTRLMEDVIDRQINDSQEIFNMLINSKIDPDSMDVFGKKAVYYTNFLDQQQRELFQQQLKDKQDEKVR